MHYTSYTNQTGYVEQFRMSDKPLLVIKKYIILFWVRQWYCMFC